MSLEEWRGRDDAPNVASARDHDAEHFLIKEERMPDGRRKLILRHKQSGQVTERFLAD